MGNKNKNILLLVALLFIAAPTVFAQTPPAPQQPPPQLPVDGGVVALVVAGLFYGIKRTLKKK